MVNGLNPLYKAGTIAWVAMLIAAVLNGAFREMVLVARFGPISLPLSGISCAIIFTLITYIMFKCLGGTYTIREVLMLGLVWLLVTVAFEFVFGHYVLGSGWDELIEAYDVTTGNLWSVLLLFTFFLPLMVSRWLVKSR